MGYESEEQQNTLETFSTEAKANIRGRVMRVRRLAEEIAQNGPHLTKKKLLGLYCLKEGISLTAAYSYLQIYIDSEIVVEYDGHLMMLDVYEETQRRDLERLRELSEKEVE